jgi:hypothetical protein
MRFEGHVASGYLISQAALSALPIEPESKLGLLAMGTIAGVLPDFDGLVYIIRKRSFLLGNDYTHHKWVSHTLPPYWLFAGLLFLVGHFKSLAWLTHAAILLALSTTGHFLLDMVGSGDGIMLLWPFSQRMFGIGKLHAHGAEWKRKYEASPFVIIERGILLGALVVFIADLLG